MKNAADYEGGFANGRVVKIVAEIVSGLEKKTKTKQKKKKQHKHKKKATRHI